MSTLLEVMIESAMRCGAGFASTCSETGTTTTLIDLQAVDQGTDSHFGSGGWIYRPDAAATTDKVRRISNDGFDTSTGTFTVTREWNSAPVSDEVYQVYAIVPPTDQPGMSESWQRLVNRGLAATWFEDTITVGGGDGTLNRRFPLADDTGWAPNEQHIKSVLFRRIDSNGIVRDMDQSRNGRFWDVLHDAGVPTLLVGQAPTAEQTVVVVAARTYPPLDEDTDETSCPLQLIALRTRYELYCYLNALPASQGQYQGEEMRSMVDWRALYQQYRPGGGVTVGY